MKKVSFKVALFVGIVEIITMSVLYILINHYMTAVLEEKAMKDMNVVAKDRAEMIDSYIESCCEFLTGYSKITEIREAPENSGDSEYIKKAQELTDRYAEGYDSIEGLYVSLWDTYVLAHVNPDSVNKTFRDAESAANLEKSIRTRGEAFCTGIVMAPVTKVIPVYAPIYNDAGEAVGFAGAAFLTDELGKKLEHITDTSNTNIEYSLLNADTYEYIFDDDISLVGAVCEYPNVINAGELLKAGGGTDGSYSYRNNDNVVSCYYMEEHNWMFVVAEKNRTVFGVIYELRSVLAVICAAITILMVIMCVISVNMQMKPLAVLQQQIDRLRANDYSQEPLIEKYSSRKDEIGTIAAAVVELQSVLENQYELFLDMLEAQPAGTLVVNTNSNQVMLINRAALEIYGNTDAADTITVEDILSRFDEEQLEKMNNFRNEVRQSDKELSVETVISVGEDKKMSILISARKTTLSNKDTVIIYSITDISDRKKLEEKLLVLSETDFLTKLCNRRSGESRIENAMREGIHGMFCLFDANKFKYVNDTFGHAVGDKVLISIAKTMKKTFRTSDVLIRLGGDEFVVFVSEIEDEDIGRKVLDRFMGNIEKIDIEEMNGHKITISLGALLVNTEESFAQMYEKADSMMYECKRRGGNNYLFYK